MTQALPSTRPAPPLPLLQRAAADEREDLLSAEVAELQRRCGEAEARLQEMAAHLPEATTPLLRQIEAMQVGAVLWSGVLRHAASCCAVPRYPVLRCAG